MDQIAELQRNIDRLRANAHYCEAQMDGQSRNISASAPNRFNQFPNRTRQHHLI